MLFSSFKSSSITLSELLRASLPRCRVPSCSPHLTDDHAGAEDAAHYLEQQPDELAQHEPKERQSDAEDEDALDRLQEAPRRLVDSRMRRLRARGLRSARPPASTPATACAQYGRCRVPGHPEGVSVGPRAKRQRASEIQGMAVQSRVRSGRLRCSSKMVGISSCSRGSARTLWDSAATWRFRLEVFVHHQAVTLGTALLRHQDQRRRASGHDVEGDFQEDEWVWIPSSPVSWRSRCRA